MRVLAKPLLVSFLIVCCLSLPAAAQPWLGVMEGNGTVAQPATLGADLGWCFRLAEKEGQYYVSGTLNIVEKLGDGNRHFQLKLKGALLASPMVYNLTTDEVRVEAMGVWKKPGEQDEEVLIAAHFRGLGNTSFPCTVWYWVKSGSTYITNSNTRLPLTGDPFTIVEPVP